MFFLIYQSFFYFWKILMREEKCQIWGAEKCSSLGWKGNIWGDEKIQIRRAEKCWDEMNYDCPGKVQLVHSQGLTIPFWHSIFFLHVLSYFFWTRWPFAKVSRVTHNKIICVFMVAFLTVHKMTKRQPAKKATGAFMAVANRHIYQISNIWHCKKHLQTFFRNNEI